MEKIEGQNIITDKTSLEYKPIELKEEIKDYWKDYEYGGTIQKLRPGIEVKKSNAGRIKIGSLTISTTGVLNITGLGFTPVYIRFTGISGVSNSFIYGIMTGTEQGTTRLARAGTMEIPSTTRVLRNTDSSDNLILQVNNNGIINDGFSLNVTTCTSTHYFLYEAYY